MKFSTLVAAVGFFAFSLFAVADEHANGWTESTFRNAVIGCVESASAKQMQFMNSSGQIKQDASAADIEAVRSRVMTYALGACTCAQKQIMHDVPFDNVQSLRQRSQ
jgi:hypothetical protein